MTVGSINGIGNSFNTVSMNISDGKSELSGLGSSNDAVKNKDMQDLANVGKNVQIPNTMVATQAHIGGILDIRA